MTDRYRQPLTAHRRKLGALAFAARSPDGLVMRVCPTKCLRSSFALACLLFALPSCGSKQATDWRNRDVAWKFGPTTGAARSEHLTATGNKGSKPLAQGWNCRLVDGKTLTVKPYKLANNHSLFGKTIMRIGLFNKASERLGTVSSDVITADNASFSFEIPAEHAKPLWDLIIWFRKP